jgi:hypothetical protein
MGPVASIDAPVRLQPFPATADPSPISRDISILEKSA